MSALNELVCEQRDSHQNHAKGVSANRGSVHCICGDVYSANAVRKVGLRKNQKSLRLVFGRGYSTKGLTKILRSYQEWASRKSGSLNGTELARIDNPFVAEICDRPIKISEQEYLWFVNVEEHQGLTEQQALEKLSSALQWAKEQSVMIFVTNGAQVVRSDLVCDDPQRVQFMTDWAENMSYQFGMHIVLVSLDNSYIYGDRKLDLEINETSAHRFNAPHDVLGSQTEKGGTLFYPGSGSDWGPLRLFEEFAHFNRVIYCDYLINWDRYFRNLENAEHKPFWVEAGYRLLSYSLFMPMQLGLLSWSELWDERSFKKPVREPIALHRMHDRLNAYLVVLERDGRVVTLFLLPTEAVGTFGYLLRRQVAIDAVVLQEHAFGGQWTTFGGDSMLYEACKQQPSSFPRWLLVGDGSTLPWPGYSAVSEGVVYRGQMHRFERKLYRLNPDLEIPRNPESIMPTIAFGLEGDHCQEQRLARMRSRRSCF